MNRPLSAHEQLEQLLHLAELSAVPHEPLHSPHSAPSIPLRQAYLHCDRLTRQHSRSFYFSSQFLPPERRAAIRALYAFCRTSDDIVDHPDGDPTLALATWVRRVRVASANTSNPVLLAWHDTCTRYEIDPSLSDELLAGVAMDLTINCYETFADLWLYCYRVASVVGLLCMDIVGAAPGAEPYAIKLGVALQMTNILRDVGEDAIRGRVYLPVEDLRRFGLTTTDILAGTNDARFKALMQFEIDRTHRLYNESWAGIAMLSPDSRLAVAAAARVYRGILDKIVAANYDVYKHRAHLSSTEKLCRLPGIWYAVRQLARSAA